MNSEVFFNVLDEALEAGKAMVSYRLPGKESVHLLSQTSDESFRIKDFSESGFLFAPFKDTKNPLFIPENESIKTILPFFEVENISSSEEKITSDSSSKAKSDHIDLVNFGIEAIQKSELKKSSAFQKRTS
ncbi:hypothetical protein [Gillisia marina]|uniref:hypothetical protein n=1 Tax=Gillisia marina TaxID=1167637 RepID=UPI0002DF0E33|nr:hypothetical protein [Gillisia marina]